MKRGWGPSPAKIKGQPLAVIAIILIGWIVFRASVIQLPVSERLRSLPIPRPAFASQAGHDAPDAATMKQAQGEGSDTSRDVDSHFLPEPAPLPQRPIDWDEMRKNKMAAGQTLLWMAAMSDLPIPAAVARVLSTPRSGDERSVVTQPQARAEVSHFARGQTLSKTEGNDRWSADGWLFLRQGSNANAAIGGVRPPVYGLSQIGAVLRYRLAPASGGHRAAAYLRASQGLVRQGESELAAGFSVRPVSALPISAHMEARATHRAGGTEIRPAAFVTTGIDNAGLPLDFAARGYVQAGYVGGSYATAFADGSLVAERTLAQRGDTRLNAGAGTWAGIQKGAKRLDVGPSASLSLSLGPVPARVALDYRLRVLGDAEPASGAALTLSTGF